MATIRKAFEGVEDSLREVSMALDNALDVELTGDPDADYDALEEAAGAISNYAEVLESVRESEVLPRLKELEEKP